VRLRPPPPLRGFGATGAPPAEPIITLVPWQIDATKRAVGVGE